MNKKYKNYKVSGRPTVEDVIGENLLMVAYAVAHKVAGDIMNSDTNCAICVGIVPIGTLIINVAWWGNEWTINTSQEHPLDEDTGGNALLLTHVKGRGGDALVFRLAKAVAMILPALNGGSMAVSLIHIDALPSITRKVFDNPDDLYEAVQDERK